MAAPDSAWRTPLSLAGRSCAELIQEELLGGRGGGRVRVSDQQGRRESSTRRRLRCVDRVKHRWRTAFAACAHADQGASALQMILGHLRVTLCEGVTCYPYWHAS